MDGVRLEPPWSPSRRTSASGPPRTGAGPGTTEGGGPSAVGHPAFKARSRADPPPISSARGRPPAEEPGPDRLALPAPEGEVVVIEERGIVDAPQAAVERPERGQQQGEGDAAVGDGPEDRPGGLADEFVTGTLAGQQRAIDSDAHQRTPRRETHPFVPW